MKETVVSGLKITSDAFKNNEYIPSDFTCEGENVNPSISINGLPESTASIAIIVDDPDAPRGTFTHWLVWNIPPKKLIKENSFPDGIEGINDFGIPKYMGPCPPSGAHRYFFKIYALDKMLDIQLNSDKENLENAMQGHILAYGEIIGLYQKKKPK